MEFEDMKKIWDVQKNKPLYVIDEQALHSQVISRNIKIRRMAAVSEWGLFIIIFLLALVMIIEGILDNELYQLPQGAVLFILAGYIYWDRRNRLKHEGPSDGTLRGDLEQALRTIDYHIKRQRNFLWWFITPVIISILITVPFTYSGKPAWLWVLVAASFALAYWLVDRELRVKIMPKKAELKSLHDLLVETES